MMQGMLLSSASLTGAQESSWPRALGEGHLCRDIIPVFGMRGVVKGLPSGTLPSVLPHLS